MATFPSATATFPSATGFPAFSFQTSLADQSLHTLAPPPIVPAVNPQWLMNIFSTVPEAERGLISTLTNQDLIQISEMEYQPEVGQTSGKMVLSLGDSEVTMTVMSILRNTPVSQLLDEVSQCKGRDDLLWLASHHRDGFLAVAREAFILQMEEHGIKGIIKCRRCQSSNVLMRSQQLRSGDEPATITTRCIDCNETWKQ